MRGLDLRRHGYTVYPMGPSYLGLPDGRGLVMAEDEKDRFDSVAAFSKNDAQALERWDAWLAGIAEVLGPLLTAVPPKLGSKRPRDLLDQARLAWRLRGLDVGSASDVTRLFAMSIGDVLREWFETDAVQAMMAVNGIIGTWAGPEEPGTAYVMLHHSIGDALSGLGGGAGSSGGGALGAWGYPRGGMGAVSAASGASGNVVRRDGAYRRTGRAGADARTGGSPASRSPTAPSWRPTSSSRPCTHRSGSSAISTRASCQTTSSPRSGGGAAAAAR